MGKRPIGMTLDAFNLKDLQTFKVIIQTLNIDGYSVADAIKYIDMMTASMGKSLLDFLTEEQREYMKEKYAKFCPKCGEPMVLFNELKSKKGKAVWRCVRNWGCLGCSDKLKFDNVDPKDLCGVEEFIDITVDEYNRKYLDELDKLIEENSNGRL